VDNADTLRAENTRLRIVLAHLERRINQMGWSYDALIRGAVPSGLGVLENYDRLAHITQPAIRKDARRGRE
jgi:hypothetical protein